MSHKYPCVYYDNGKCQKFSDDHYTSWCDFDQCEFQTPSNGDRFRQMSDERIAIEMVYLSSHCEFCFYWQTCKNESDLEKCVDGISTWLKQPSELQV